MRSVGVPSIQECSPRNPDRPLSKTITAYRNINKMQSQSPLETAIRWCLSYHRFRPSPPKFPHRSLSSYHHHPPCGLWGVYPLLRWDGQLGTSNVGTSPLGEPGRPHSFYLAQPRAIPGPPCRRHGHWHVVSGDKLQVFGPDRKVVDTAYPIDYDAHSTLGLWAGVVAM